MTEHICKWQALHEYLVWCPECGKPPKAKDVIHGLGQKEIKDTYVGYFERMKDKAPEDFYYMVALLEGEGCFTPRPRIEIGMNDREPIERIAVLWRTGVYEIKNKGKKMRYFAQIGGKAAIGGMKVMRPHLCKRRQTKIDSIVDAYNIKWG